MNFGTSGRNEKAKRAGRGETGRTGETGGTSGTGERENCELGTSCKLAPAGESYTIQVNNPMKKTACANCSNGCLKIKNNDN